MDSAQHGTSECWARTLPGEMGAVDAACALVESFCAHYSLGERARMALSLVLEELITNAIKHGGAYGERAIALRLSAGAQANSLHITLSDNGAAFDPRTDRPQDPRDLAFDDRPEGGLGWPLVLHYAMIEDYARRGERNCLRLGLNVPC